LDAAIVATRWLPSRTPRALMNTRLIGALNWTGRVYVPDEVIGRPVDLPSPPDYEIIRWPVRYYSLAARVMGRLGINPFQCPDHLLLWALEAGRKVIRHYRKHAYDLLVTLGKYDSSHLAGLVAQQELPDLPWIAVFSDPWTDLEQFGFHHYPSRAIRAVNRWLEQAVLNHADRVVVTSEETRNLLARRYPADVVERIHVITQCFDPGLYPPRSSPRQDDPDILLIRHLGDFYGPRSPRPLLEAMHRWRQDKPDFRPQFQIELIGKFAPHDAQECRELMAGQEWVTILDEVDYLESLRLMVESDLLLLIDPPLEESPFLPSKLVEYIGADRPLLGITAPGAATRVLTRAGALVADIHNLDSIVETLAALGELHHCGRLSRHRPHPDLRSRFEKRQVGAQFNQLARELLET